MNVPQEMPPNGTPCSRVRTLDVICGSSPSPPSHRPFSRVAAEASERTTLNYASSSSKFSQSSLDATGAFRATKPTALLDNEPVNDTAHQVPGYGYECTNYPPLLPFKAAGTFGDDELVDSLTNHSEIGLVQESSNKTEGVLIDISEPCVGFCPPEDPFDGIECLSQYGKTSDDGSLPKIADFPVENSGSPIKSVNSPIEDVNSPVSRVSSTTSIGSSPSPRDDPSTVEEKTSSEYEYTAIPAQLTDFGPSCLPSGGYHGPVEFDLPLQDLFGNPHFEESSQLPEDLSYHTSPTIPSPLLALPGEVRCLIYRHIFTCGARVNLQHPGCWFYLFKQPMFHASQQIRHETLTLLYHETYFEFDPVADATISAAFLLPYLKQVKHLSINCWQSNQGFLAGSIMYFVGLGVELQSLEVRFMTGGVSVPKVFRKDNAVGKALAKTKVTERIVFHFGGEVGDYFGDTVAFQTLKEVLAPGKEWTRAVAIKRGFWMRMTQSTSWSVNL